MKSRSRVTVTAAIIATAGALPSAAQADEFRKNVFRVGYAYLGVDVDSGDLAGPLGTTPPGLGIQIEDLDVLAISYERRLSSRLAIQLQAGIPPTLTAVGTGAAQSVGTVAKARIWFPTVMAIYTFADVPVIRPYVGVGVTYTFFTQVEASPAYTAALLGTSSSMELEDSWSPYVRIGFEYPFHEHWSLRAEYSSFRMKTTATVETQTPIFGAISRTVDIKDYPSIFGLSVGYSF